MSIPLVFTKQLAAASANNIAASQTPSSAALTLNGSATNYLSTTTTAAVLAGGTVLPLSSVTGLTVGQQVTDTTAVTLVTGTTITAIGTASVTIWPPVGGVGVGSGDTIVFPGTAIIDTATAANSAIGRRVIVTSGGNDTGITWKVVGTNASGATITDTFAGVSGGAAQSNLDFVTVISITPSGAVASTATAGTNGVGSSPWMTMNWHVEPINIGFSVELVSGAANYTIQHTYMDPNNLGGGGLFPPAFNNFTVNGVAVSADGNYSTAITALRLLINSGTGALRCTVTQAGIG
jgi:hypothetical protein